VFHKLAYLIHVQLTNLSEEIQLGKSVSYKKITIITHKTMYISLRYDVDMANKVAYNFLKRSIAQIMHEV
jgi:hypothetical protein